MQIEGTKLIFIMNFSVLDFFKFAFRMPQIAQILVSTFKIFWGRMPPNPPENVLFFLSSSRLWFFYSAELCNGSFPHTQPMRFGNPSNLHRVLSNGILLHILDKDFVKLPLYGVVQ